MHSTIGHIASGRIIAVIRGDSTEKVIRTVDALAEGGITLMEITFTNDNPLKIIEACTQREGILVGAGTVLSASDTRDAISAGARFIVSPCTVPEVIEAGFNANVPVTPGVFTPTEVYNALALGVEVLKLFPGSIGGIGHMKALKAPFPDLKIIPTGGVDKNNAKEWLKAGALAIGVGANMVPKDAIAAEDYDRIRCLAEEMVAAVQ